MKADSAMSHTERDCVGPTGVQHHCTASPSLLPPASWAYQTEMDKMDENGRWWKKMGKSGWKLIAWANWGYQTEMANKDYISKKDRHTHNQC